ncbi:hypothetical protein CYK25_005875 [Varibaculum cambriense]|nr:hypothetical protein CYK25_005875 [Varibaculum cambriense]
MLGGGRVNYYFDNRDHRFDPASLNKPEKERPKPMPLKYTSINDQGFQAVTSEQAKANASSAGKLLVQGNAAPRGGGIGTNGGVLLRPEVPPAGYPY